MKLKDRIDALENLGAEISKESVWMEQAVQSAYLENQWFTPDNSWKALHAIKSQFLNADLLGNWAEAYGFEAETNPKVVGLVLAGNIPMVGFHDVLCCFVSGNKAKIKCSSKDAVLLKAVLDRLLEMHPECSSYFEIVEQLKDFGAVIATGSNNSSRYFEQYFGKYPHIIRKNRSSVAIIDGTETDDELLALGEDIFTYFGLGCRNVSKLFVPDEYNFEQLLQVLHEGYKEIAHHNKYKNNFDYNNALFLLNKVDFLMSGSLILTAAPEITSRIATLHYEHYSDRYTLVNDLLDKKDEIQCVVSKTLIDELPSFTFGQAQKPGISDYADGIDTMAFLKSL